MYASLIIQVNVPGGCTGSSRSDTRIEMEPFPGPFSGHQSQNVNIDVIEATSGDNFRCLGEFLMISAHFARKIVVGGSVAHF